MKEEQKQDTNEQIMSKEIDYSSYKIISVELRKQIAFEILNFFSEKLTSRGGGGMDEDDMLMVDLLLVRLKLTIWTLRTDRERVDNKTSK